MRRCLLLSALLPCVSVLHAEAPCTATPAEAVMQRLGLPAGTVGSGGFRVHDVLVDHALLRTFVRIERCGHPGEPLTLLPFATISAVHPQSSAAAPVVLPPQQLHPMDLLSETSTQVSAGFVHAGSAVSVSMLNATTSVKVQGRLLSAAAVGSDVDVELASWPGSDKPGLHVRGRLLDNGRVEVQP